MVLLLILVGVSIVLFKPADRRRQARDVARLTDITSLDRAINEYRIDKGDYPDNVGIERRSTSLPLGNTGPTVVCSDGWIDANLCEYISKLYVDPENDATYYYSYISTGTSYELNVTLEAEIDKMTTDGGNSDTKYELGNNKLLL
jgi:hypothetical protein